MPWDYLKAQVSVSGLGNDLKILVDGIYIDADDIGAQGYELVTVIPNASGPETPPVGIFKRHTFVDEAIDC